jgi:phosphoglycolate phosphatase-like HAD superfamily hydrolase
MRHCLLGFVLALVPVCGVAQQKDTLPSWNEGATKRALLDFVAKVTKEGSPDFVPPEARIATFDNDGTLWCEQPLYVQAVFTDARVKALAPQHPEWKTQLPFKAVLDADRRALVDLGEKGLVELVTATHSGMTPDEYHQIVLDWLAATRHPRFKRAYTKCVYQPMLEVLALFRAHGFKTYIVSGGGVEFMRPWTAKAYGVPPEQVIGSSGKLAYELRQGKPLLLKLPEVNFIDDGAGKPIGIEQYIGRRPIAAFGNSDGDYEMLRWTTAGDGPRFGLIVHHTDAEREYAYDHPSAIGQLKRALAEAPERGWSVADMQRDWKAIFPAEK